MIYLLRMSIRKGHALGASRCGFGRQYRTRPVLSCVLDAQREGSGSGSTLNIGGERPQVGAEVGPRKLARMRLAGLAIDGVESLIDEVRRPACDRRALSRPSGA